MIEVSALTESNNARDVSLEWLFNLGWGYMDQPILALLRSVPCVISTTRGWGVIFPDRKSYL